MKKVIIGLSAVLISAFVSLTLTPMLNAYLMKGGEQKKSKFQRININILLKWRLLSVLSTKSYS